jgi:CRP/FNR family transcriptional regulator
METWTAERIRQFMAASRWMGSLAEPLRERLVGMAVVRAYAPGASIYLQDDPPFGLAIVLDGTVRLTRTSMSGRETLVHVGQSGFWFGELAVLLDCPTQVAATARERAVLLVFPAGPLQRLLSVEPEHYAPLARSALEHYALLLNQLEQHRRTGVAARIATKLLILAAIDRTGLGTTPPRFSVKQSELAEMVSLSRQTVNGTLTRFARAGLVELGVGSITVANLDGLSRLAEADGELEPI